MNIDTFRTRTGLKFKEAAKALKVNPVTLTRWKQRHGGEIPADYKEIVQKILKARKGKSSPLKAPPKVVIKVVKRKQKLHKETPKHEIIRDFYEFLKEGNDPEMTKIKEELEEYMIRKWMLVHT